MSLYGIIGPAPSTCASGRLDGRMGYTKAFGGESD